MKIRIGTDLVNLKRFSQKLAKTPSMGQAFASPQELKTANPTHLAGIFAAKEAIIKALDLSAGTWLTIEIIKNDNGKPILKLPQNLRRKIKSCDLTITHDGDYVAANFVALVND